MNALDKTENEMIATHSVCPETLYLRFTSLFGEWAKIKAYLFFFQDSVIVKTCVWLMWLTLVQVNWDFDSHYLLPPQLTKGAAEGREKKPWFLLWVSQTSTKLRLCGTLAPEFKLLFTDTCISNMLPYLFRISLLFFSYSSTFPFFYPKKERLVNVVFAW